MTSSLGREIARTRAKGKFSLREVAAKSGLSRQAVLDAERGLARLETALKIAKAVGVSAAKMIELVQDDVAGYIRQVA